MWTAGHMVPEAEPLRLKKKKKSPPSVASIIILASSQRLALPGGKSQNTKDTTGKIPLGRHVCFCVAPEGVSLIVGAQQLNEGDRKRQTKSVIP